MGFNFGKMGDLVALQQKGSEAMTAFSELKAAVKGTDFNAPGKSRFDSILSALDKIVDILKFIQGLKGVPQAQAAATQGLADTQALREDVTAGAIKSKDEMQQRVDDLLAKYKDQLGPLAAALK
jgi:hypothetical protein